MKLIKMKKFKNIALFFLLAATALSCEKHVIEYDSTDVTGLAEFQLHYFVPVVAGAANNIYKIEINGEQYANSTSPLSTYNAVPSGAVGKFYTTKVGENNIKLYKGEDLELVYDQNVTLTAGKQNVFVHDFNKAPIVFDNGFPYESPTTEDTGELEWVKFYNFMYETEGVPTDLKLQYQAQYIIDNETKEKSDWVNVGQPVSFGEATDWVPIHVNVSVEISSGYDRVDYRIRMIDAGGNDLGPLKIMNSSNNFVDYSDWWTGYIGRRYHHVLSGMRAAKPTTAVRQFTAL